MGEFISNHQCMLYSGAPETHLPGLASVAKQQLEANWRCLLLNSPQHLAEMRVHLAGAGVSVADEVSRGALILSSGQDHLQEGRFDVDRMLGMLADAVDQATNAGFQGLWASGDMSWEFGDETNFGKLVKYEYALERFIKQQPALRGVCQYNLDTLPNDAVQWGLCTHRSVYINEGLSQENPYYSPANLLTYRGPVASPVQLEGMLARPVKEIRLTQTASKISAA